jgi:23S rRNA (cytosine1962-C5)-methyltransferase
LHEGQFLGLALFHAETDIALRVISRHDEIIDASFFARRFQGLLDYRLRHLPSYTDAYRVAFGEADGLPGMVVDRYADHWVFQIHTLGMESLRPLWQPVLEELSKKGSLVERSDVASRRREGMEPIPPRILQGNLEGPIEIREYGRRYRVDLLQGQKTGFFLDQRENRQALTRWVEGRNLLNVCCYSGGFSVAAAATAKSVHHLDISGPALSLCRENMLLNGFSIDDHEFIKADAFDYLRDLDPHRFDAILLDPPSFAKHRGQLKGAIKAYTSLNTLALKKLPVGGILASASCTTHVDSLTFVKILNQSAAHADCGLKILDSREQPFDHPYHLSFPEGRYLKFFVLEKCER